MEGGGPTLACISWYQNGLGGAYLQQFYRDVNLTKGSPFVLRLDTCDFPASPTSFPNNQLPPPPQKREADWKDGGDLSDLGGKYPTHWFPDPHSEADGFLVIPLMNIGTGLFGGDLTIATNDTLNDVCIIDAAGETLWSSPGTWASQVNAQYQVQDDTQDMFVAARASAMVDVTATLSQTAVPFKSTSSSSAVMSSSTTATTGLLMSFVLSCWFL